MAIKCDKIRSLRRCCSECDKSILLRVRRARTCSERCRQVRSRRLRRSAYRPRLKFPR